MMYLTHPFTIEPSLYLGVTMDDIANEIGISKKTIYVHFDNKTKLVQTVTFTLFNNISEGIDGICMTTDNPIEELYDIKMFVMKHLKNEKASPQYQLKKYYPSIYDKLKQKQFDKMQDSVSESLLKGIETGVFRPKIDVSFIS